jgi:hypothetical protein
MMACPRGPDGRGHTVTAIARVLTIGAAVGASVGCTYHAAIGGQGRIHGDDTIGDVKAPRGVPILMVGAGPCLRWPRLRTSLTFDAALRGVSLIPFGAAEVVWLFDEGYARESHGVVRTSLGLKSRLAGGWNGITDRWIAEAGLGVAIVIDTYHHRDLTFTRDVYVGDYHGASLDVLVTYAPDQAGEDEAWLGAQLSFDFNGLGSPGGQGGKKWPTQQYGLPGPGESTDCNGGHVP